jgi:hypothetical protein
VNRRNYYRVLHVQPDAPAEVVKAAYRVLISRHHPDQGGDHELTVLLNEAWAVLGDPVKRAAYDAKRARAGVRPRTGAEARAEPRPTRRASSDSARTPTNSCPFCGMTALPTDAACRRCTSPLTRVQRQAASSTAGERRRLPRVSRADWGTIKPTWQSDALDIRLRNLSLGGVSFYVGVPLDPGAHVRVTAAAFDAVIEVIICRRTDAIFVVQAAFVTVRFVETGGFVYTRA